MAVDAGIDVHFMGIDPRGCRQGVPVTAGALYGCTDEAMEKNSFFTSCKPYSGHTADISRTSYHSTAELLLVNLLVSHGIAYRIAAVQPPYGANMSNA